MNQEMEESIVCSGYGAPQAGLTGSFLLPFRKMSGLLQQVIGVSHRGSCPSRVVKVSLLGETAKIEIVVQPLFIGSDLIHELHLDLPGNLA